MTERRSGVLLAPTGGIPGWWARASEEGWALSCDAEAARRAAGPAEAAAALAMLRIEVPVHFAAEERPGGVFTRIHAFAPDRERAVRTLLDEHDALLHRLAGLGAPGACTVQAVRDLGEALVAHERAEAALLGMVADRLTSPPP